MQRLIYKLISLFVFLILNSFIYGCSNKKDNTVTPLSPIIIPEVEDIPNHPKKNSEIFKPYPNPEALVSQIEIGKEDPFSFGVLEGKSPFSDEVIFSGIISNGEETFALVKYKDKSGAIKVGDEGVISTDLLPRNVKVVNIDLKEDTLNLKYKNKIYYLSINTN